MIKPIEIIPESCLLMCVTLVPIYFPLKSVWEYFLWNIGFVFPHVLQRFDLFLLTLGNRYSTVLSYKVELPFEVTVTHSNYWRIILSSLYHLPGCLHSELYMFHTYLNAFEPQLEVNLPTKLNVLNSLRKKWMNFLRRCCCNASYRRLHFTLIE